MIQFQNLTKSFMVKGHRNVVIDNLNLTLPTGRSLALLGRNGAGKSTLLQLISGAQRPDHGRIVSDGTISWPVGLRGAFHGDLSGAENTRFIARIYGVDSDELVDFVRDFAELGQSFYMPMRTYSSGMRSRLAFGASLGIRFDTYLIDEVTAVGDASFRRKSRALFADRMKTSSAIMVSHSMTEVRAFCDSGMILDQGRVTYFEDIEEAIEQHKKMLE